MEKYINAKDLAKNIKVIIFDFDATMYSSENERDFYIAYIKNTIMKLSGHTEEETVELMNKFGFTKENTATPSFTSSCPNFDIKREDWDSYRVDNYVETDYENAQVIDNDLLKTLANNYKLYIVSNEVEKNIVEKSHKLGIDLSYFQQICAPTAEELLSKQTKTKKEYYQQIINENNISAQNVIVFGDRIKVDVEPIVELGGNGVVVSKPDEIKAFCEKNLFQKNKQKVLILTVTVGSGHNQVANNIAKKFIDNNYNVLIYDMFKNKKFHNFLITKNLTLMSKMSNVANFVYNQLKKSDKNPFYAFNKHIKNNLLELVNSYQPDIIVSAHVAGYLFVEIYGTEFIKKVKNYFIVTDYDLPPALHPIKHQLASFVVVPNEDFTENLVAKGFKRENILPFGIPIKEEFYNVQSKEDALKELNLQLDETKNTVLVIGGGNGVGNNYKVIKKLMQKDDVEIISVAGKNKKLKAKIDELAQKSTTKIISYGFTDKVCDLLSVADVVVGKAGGLTATESLTKGKPLIVVGKTANPEFTNLQYLSQKGYALAMKTPNQLSLFDADNLAKLKGNCANWAKNQTSQLFFEHATKN